ncbi:MAG: mechanosensitive ion channel family protein [Acidimicrobiales bacterium]
MLTLVAASWSLVAASSSIVATRGLTPWDGLRAGIIVVVTVALALAARRVVMRAFGRDGDGFVARMTGRLLAYVVVVAGFVYVLIALHVQIGPLVGALGIGGIALAFALQDILQNLVAGIIIQARRPLRHGDQVQLGTHTGVVRDIDLRTVLVRTFDGLDVYVPNRTVLQNPLVNYTISPNRRITLTVGVGYGADLAVAQRCLVEAVRPIDGVLDDPEPAAWVTSFGTSSIVFAVLMWFPVATHNLWKVQSDAAMAVKKALDAAGIDIPFPQRTVSLEPDLGRALLPAPHGHAGGADGDGGAGGDGGQSSRTSSAR